MIVILIHFKFATDYKIKKHGSLEDIFILSERYHRCSTYFNKSRLAIEKCPICLNAEMSSFPILPNEAFTFIYNDKHGVESEFRPRKKKEEKKQERKTNTAIALKNISLVLSITCWS
jgi:hypothetical protein